ncbi:hypothetical protein LPJ75_001121 [Coemansia sp. RSA 2598]|nr:hypothetical protein LPJ75_001121 [Coemansia sp. RSA 2598]
MEYVYQHLQEIVRELHRNSQASLPSTPPPSSLAAGQSLWSAPELEFMVALLGQEHMLSAMQLVDRGVVCLTSGTRSLFRIGRQGHSGEQDLCFCILPGRFCTSCSAGNSHAADGKSFQKVSLALSDAELALPHSQAQKS